MGLSSPVLLGLPGVEFSIPNSILSQLLRPSGPSKPLTGVSPRSSISSEKIASRTSSPTWPRFPEGRDSFLKIILSFRQVFF